MTSIKETDACQFLNEVMSQWGLPKRIKIDNGNPLACAGSTDLPTLTQLWWIGLGIEVQLNAPNVPQQNGVVEGLQGICHRWSNPKAYQEMEAYQKRIDQTTQFQREHYRIRRKGDKTRKELYPELWDNKRAYKSINFEITRIYEHLSNKIWDRRIRSCGGVSFWNHNIYVGKTFAHHPVTVTFDPIELQWLVRLENGTLLKASNKEIFTEENILIHAGISKN